MILFTVKVLLVLVGLAIKNVHASKQRIPFSPCVSLNMTLV